MAFIKPSKCDNSGPNCFVVERKNGMVYIRNSNDPEKATVAGTDAEWDALTESIKNGQTFREDELVDA